MEQLHTEKQLTELEDELRTAMLSSDVKQLDALLSDDLLFISHTGAIVSKNDDLQNHSSGILKISKLDFKEREFRYFTDGGVVSVATEVAGTFDTHPFSACFRYTRVWTFQSGRWQVLAAQATSHLNDS